jgi:hypothetical protein
MRTSVDEISEQGRDATGVRVARVGDDESVVAVARVLETEAATGAAVVAEGPDDAVDTAGDLDASDDPDAGGSVSDAGDGEES